jgi:hypothetical protein
MKNISNFFLSLFMGITLISCHKYDLGLNSSGSMNLAANCPEIESFVEEHFPDLTIRKIELEKKGTQPTYYVYLTGNVDLEFNLQCEIIEIETQTGVPASALMPSIVSYVANNFPNNIILEWELYPNYQEITLNNGTTIDFDLSGQPLSGDPEACEEITTFVETHFPSLTILKIELEDDEEYGSYYDVYLTGNVDLEFNLQCEIIEIETQTGVPASALMPSIVSYVANNFPNNIILEWELYPNYQEITLNNGWEISFDFNGNFIEIDD